ncbi:hypothetical protein LTR36_002740 [Oleoguttula mirabilis]|uniref:Checkpoint protein RAD24-like helical bundle domain-containing protein n=1 Tax=Oleoguttula mirabilis TaxID=1507867 RepID=A0AAV9JMR7_9PEZI|nr:hypothetical protein LTR36_002740 [Oleoguttula mirabilis]
MGQPRASRRKVVAVSSDEEDEPTPVAPAAVSSEDEEPVKPQKRSTGKLKSIKKSTVAQQFTPTTSTQGGSSQVQKSPAKPKASKVKSKTAVKDPAKTTGKPIYSFFNAATQRQRLSEPSASPEKPVPKEEPEAIHDGSDDDGTSVALSNGSSVALAMRKRKVQHGQSFEDDATLPPPATQKFRKTSDGGRTPSFTVTNEDKRPWTEQFAPSDLLELAVHKRKVTDVRQWLNDAVNGRRRKVLVMKGAAGTGKTATVRLLAKDMSFEVSEWRNPAGADLTSEGSLSTTEQFGDFVRVAGKSTGLTLFIGDETNALVVEPTHDDSGIPECKKQMLLIEEFPNTFSRSSATLQAFRSTILQYVSSPPVSHEIATPIVLVISETLLSTNTAAADSFTAHRLLGPELVNHPYVNMIEFNSIAPTILTKALETIVVKEARKSGRRKTPGPQVIKHLAETGDIRSAISSLEFLCLRGDDGDSWSSKVAFTKPKKAKAEPAMTKAEEEALKLISNRESTLGIFHAVGRVVYNKRVDPVAMESLAQPPPWLPQHRRTKVPEAKVDMLIDELGTDTPTFLAALHENYALSCSCSGVEDTLDSLGGSIDNISDADLLSVDRFSFGTRAFSGSATDGLRQDEMAFQVAVRGVLYSLPSPVHRNPPAGSSKADAHRMFYPTSLKLWKAREEVESMLGLLTARLQSNSFDDVSRSRVNGPADTGGVERWKRNNNVRGMPEGLEQHDGEQSRIHLSAITKKEALLERLPYMAQIRSARQAPTSSDTALGQILSVTRVNDQASRNPSDEDAAEEEPDISGAPEQWTTDKPDPELQADMKKASAARSKGKRKAATEGGGLSISVESCVEKLVLEDDDIVDD